MGTAQRLNKKQMLLLLLVILSLLITIVIVLHAATPNLYHAFAFKPDFISRH